MYIYLGKCTFNYEIYNPTNYIITVFIYDLVCRRETNYDIKYSDTSSAENESPEMCMKKGASAVYQNNDSHGYGWIVADPAYEVSPADWNTVGMKPTDYHYFNTFWKVKGMKKIILPPTSSHHHVVVFNPKKVMTQAKLFYPHNFRGSEWKGGLAGITQATLFGFQGQVATESGSETNSTAELGTLPGKILLHDDD